MSKAQKDSAPWVISANELASGRVVYFDGSAFTFDLDRAKVFDNKETLLAQIGILEKGTHIVDLTYFGVDGNNTDGLRVRRLRERIRSLGPTIEYGVPAHVSL